MELMFKFLFTPWKLRNMLIPGVNNDPINKDPINNSPFFQSSNLLSIFDPIFGPNFLLLNGQNFLLLNGTNLELLTG